MHPLVISYLRFAGFSLAALALAACAKLAPPQPFAGPPEPRFGEPPSSAGRMAAAPDKPVSDAERIAALEAQVNTLDAELTHLRKALDVMGPLPEQATFYIPVDKSEITGEAPVLAPEDEAAAKLAKLYAVAPSLKGGSSLFFEAELGAYGSRAAAEAGWNRLAAENKLASLKPRYTAAGGQTRLTAGPLASEAEVTALCVDISSLAGNCRVAAPIRAY